MKNNEILKAITYLASNDKVMKGLSEKYPPFRPEVNANPFAGLCESIIGQQLSMKAANSIIARFREKFGNPEPGHVWNAPPEDLKKMGISERKIGYIKGLAQAALNKEPDLDNIGTKTDEEIIFELTKLKGIGIWTAHMFLIFDLGRPDVLPWGDLGIRKAIMNNYGLDDLPDENKVKEIARAYKWSPYTTLASWYLWKSLGNS